MGSSGDLHSTGHSEERNSFDVSPWAELSVQGLHTLAPSLRSREPQGAHSLVGRATGLTALQTPNPAHGAQAPSLQLIIALSQTLPCSALTHSTPSHASLPSAACQAPPTLEPANERYSLCLECSPASSSHGCFLFSRSLGLCSAVTWSENSPLTSLIIL